MSRTERESPKAARDTRFWDIVGELHWVLDDGDGGSPPAHDRGYGDRPGRGAWPMWATHLIAFLLGGVTWGALLLAPPIAPVLVLAGIIGFVAVAVVRRWR